VFSVVRYTLYPKARVQYPTNKSLICAMCYAPSGSMLRSLLNKWTL
jgi:hypothetical protein